MTSQSTRDKLGRPWDLAAPEALRGRVQDLFKETQKAMTIWMARRQEAADLGSQAFQALCASKNPAAFASAYGEWVTRSMNLFAEEVTEAQEQAFRCAEISREFATAAFRSAPEPGKPAARIRADSANESASARSAAE
jgi:hypothetical protein